MTKKILIIAMLTSLSFAEKGKTDRSERRHGMSAEKKAELIEKFDKDGDGKINEEEKNAAREARMNAIFDKADTDKNGAISKDEFKKLALEMKAKRGSRKKGCRSKKGCGCKKEAAVKE